MIQPDKRYLIFISSTFADLEQEREAVAMAIRQEGHIPIGMELFLGGQRSSWDVITSAIDEADYYVLVVAHRWGSRFEKERASWTQKEYEYAVSNDVPVLPLIISHDAPWPETKRDRKGDGFEASTKKKYLDKFKGQLRKNHQVSSWDSGATLASELKSGLKDLMVRFPRPGWVRDESDELLHQLGLLTVENNKLKARLAGSASLRETPSDAHLDNLSGELATLPCVITWEYEYHEHESGPAPPEALLSVFRAVAGLLTQAPATAREAGRALTLAFKDDPHEPAWIGQDGAKDALLDLKSHGLVASGEERWSLTDLGEALFQRDRRRLQASSKYLDEVQIRTPVSVGNSTTQHPVFPNAGYLLGHLTRTLAEPLSPASVDSVLEPLLDHKRRYGSTATHTLASAEAVLEALTRWKALEKTDSGYVLTTFGRQYLNGQKST